MADLGSSSLIMAEHGRSSLPDRWPDRARSKPDRMADHGLIMADHCLIMA